MRSKFIVVEGLEGSGKSSAVKKIADILRQKYGLVDLIITRDPGGTLLSESLRNLIKKGVNDELITDHAELLMFYAARVQLIEQVIKPSLSKNIWVISDRYDLSSHAYQGGGRAIDVMLLKALRNLVIKNFQPDLTFYLDVSPIVGLSRIFIRDTSLDRIERESLDFFNRVRSCYRLMASKNHRIITIDAHQTLQDVHKEIFIYLKKWLMVQGA
ncbi:thymidylate kinase [Blochmannia endosymbiont of Camponotus (Colobopsis) obliquus]|nr:thymidylate kinase [Blochmannia endosymbiont of Camponotus (Colobopsis) obliquus]